MAEDWNIEEEEQPVAAGQSPPQEPTDIAKGTNENTPAGGVTEGARGSAQMEAASCRDNFPPGLKDALALLKQTQGSAKLPDRPTPEQRARRAKYLRLKKHVAKLQEGLPIIQTDAHSPAAFIGLHHAGLERTKLEHLARTNPLIKKLLAERDALKKENAELKAPK